MVSLVSLVPLPAFADVASGLPQPVLAVGVPLLFAVAYLLVVLEEVTHMRKSKPVILAAGLIWTLIAIFPPTNVPVHGEAAEAVAASDDATAGDDATASAGTAEATGTEGREGGAFGPSQGASGTDELMAAREQIGEAVRHYLMEYAELFLFLLVAMTYVNAMDERRVFDVLRDRLVSSGMGYRSLFWATGWIAFFLSPILDNMTTALVTCAALAAVGRESPKFVAIGCVNLVVASNAGGAFSPFGDITTLMVWQDGKLPFFDFFALFVPSLVNFIIPAICMHFAVPKGRPPALEGRARFRRGAIGVMFLFGCTITTVVCMHNFLHLPPVLGMMTGLAYLKLYSYYLTVTSRRYGYVANHGHANGHGNGNGNGEDDDPSITDRDAEDIAPFDSFSLVARAEWDTLLFFFGVTLCVGGLGYIGYLQLAATTFYEGWGETPANIAIGVLSAIVDNIPVMMAVLEMDPAMSEGQWLLVTLTAGVGGSMLSIGSAAGVALMGQSRGLYTFGKHLVWTPAIALGYAASIAVHFWWNSELFLVHAGK
ncbi:MAG: sodium:proton antiporter NhaD [Planctomycetaceae bacterium]|nr:sodium:proton antiporter NhaD [Planctomycetaceae bacterium]